MDPLGLPFEQFTHYGRQQRTGGPCFDTSGAITFVDEKIKTGEVIAIELMKRLKFRTREQVFVRHAFRFFMGRNETLGDALTLRNAHKAYREKNGSFEAWWYPCFPLIPFFFALRVTPQPTCKTSNEKADRPYL